VAVLSAGGVVVEESGVAAPVSAGGVAEVSAGGGAADESAGGLADGEEDSCFAQADASNRAAILRTKALRFIMDHLTDKNGCPQGSGCVSRSVARPPGAASEQHTLCPSTVTKAVAQPSGIVYFIGCL
jgi:hypothetical protein